MQNQLNVSQPRSFRISKFGTTVRPPVHVWGGLIALSIYFAFTPNPLMTIASLVSLALFAMIVWRKGEPPLFFLPLALQWTEVVTKVFQANMAGLTLEELYGEEIKFGGPEINQAFWLALSGLFILAFGMRIGMRGARLPVVIEMQNEASRLSNQRLFMGYFVFLILSSLAEGTLLRVPGLAQYVYALFAFKWSLFYLLAYTVFKKGSGRILLLTVFIFEVLIGLSQYFSAFKVPFFILFLAYLSVEYRFKMKSIVKLSFLTGILFFLCTVWTAVKPDYRAFLDSDQGGHRSVLQRLHKFYDLYTDLDFPDGLKESQETLLDRVSYITYFAKVIKRVPSEVSRETGANSKMAIEHVTKPRIFFPNKPIVDDSGIVMKYTGDHVPSGTSISIGYMAELYADFGIPGMLISVFTIGIFLGLMCRILVSSLKVKLFGYIACIAILLPFWSFGSALSKLLGGTITSFIVLGLSMKFVGTQIYQLLSMRRKIYLK